MGVCINDVDSMRGVRIWRGEGVFQRGREGQRHGPAQWRQPSGSARTGTKLSALVDVRESTLCLCGCDFVCVMCVDVMRACLVRERVFCGGAVSRVVLCGFADRAVCARPSQVSRVCVQLSERFIHSETRNGNLR